MAKHTIIRPARLAIPKEPDKDFVLIPDEDPCICDGEWFDCCPIHGVDDDIAASMFGTNGACDSYGSL